MNKEYIDTLHKRLAQLDQERDAILKLLEVWGESGPAASTIAHSKQQSFSTSGRIVDAVIELVHKNGKPVKNSEIMEYITEKGLPLGNTKDPVRLLSAILSNESKKKNARIKQPARGYFDIKQ